MPALADALGFYLRRYQCHDLSLMRLSNATIGSAVIQMALPLASGLTLLPLYGLARRAYDQRIAAWVVALYPLVSSFALWAGRWEQFYPLLACTTWYFFHVGLTESRRSALLAAGFTLSIASLLNFSVLALLLPLGLFALFWLIAAKKQLLEKPKTHRAVSCRMKNAARVLGAHPDRYRCHWWRLIADALVFCLGLASLWIIYQLAFGVGFIDIWRVSMSYHLGLNRSYWTWLFYHLYDFFLFLGIPLALLFVVAAIKAVRDLFRFAKRQAPSAIDPLTLGFASGLLLLDLSGVARGEVARVWIFLTPFAALVAARGLARLRLGRRGFLLVACLLALQLLTFNTFLRVVTTGLDDPPSRAHVFEPPPIAHPLDALFSADGADAIALLGYDLEPESPAPGDTLHLTLYWQALRPLTRPYNVFTHLLDSEGQLVGQQDNAPLRDTAPTTCWLPGEIIADPYDIPVDSQTPPGDYVLATGFYFWMTGERLPVSGAAAGTDNRIVLPPISIGAR
ncbi:MAG: glycosyltransferase family 39 protein, partial [Chloroflexota bacterium]|nr:glycosyltransferase family 39 protein [Chloroflexota bacterium]